MIHTFQVTRLSKPIQCNAPRVKYDVTYGFWVIMMCQPRFISWNKCTTVVEDAGNGGGRAFWGQRGYGKFLYLPLNFVRDLNCSKKITYVKKKNLEDSVNCEVQYVIFCSVSAYLNSYMKYFTNLNVSGIEILDLLLIVLKLKKESK